MLREALEPRGDGVEQLGLRPRGLAGTGVEAGNHDRLVADDRRQAAADLQLLPVAPANFHRAAELVLDAASALRAGDALHLACAEAAGAKYIATLDDVLSRNAQRLKIKPVVLRGKR